MVTQQEIGLRPVPAEGAPPPLAPDLPSRFGWSRPPGRWPLASPPPACVVPVPVLLRPWSPPWAAWFGAAVLGSRRRWGLALAIYDIERTVLLTVSMPVPLPENWQGPGSRLGSSAPGGRAVGIGFLVFDKRRLCTLRPGSGGAGRRPFVLCPPSGSGNGHFQHPQASLDD